MLTTLSNALLLSVGALQEMILTFSNIKKNSVRVFCNSYVSNLNETFLYDIVNFIQTASERYTIVKTISFDLLFIEYI